MLLDTMGSGYCRLYRGIPAGTAVIDIKGRIAYWNHGSPWGCRPQSAEKAIKRLLAKNGGAKARLWAPVRLTRTGLRPADRAQPLPAEKNEKKGPAQQGGGQDKKPGKSPRRRSL